MTIEQIAIRQEVRQMLAEAGITKEYIREYADTVIKEETHKAMDNILKHQLNTASIINREMSTYNFRDTLRHAIADEVANQIRFNVKIEYTTPDRSSASDNTKEN